MKPVTFMMQSFHADVAGAAFIEYTALLSVILAVGFGVLTIVGNWANALDRACLRAQRRAVNAG
jgi:Flp pilus assembly pilin Flp